MKQLGAKRNESLTIVCQNHTELSWFIQERPLHTNQSASRKNKGQHMISGIKLKTLVFQKLEFMINR